MVKIVHKKSPIESVKKKFFSKAFYQIAFLFLLVMALPVIIINLNKEQDIRQQAAQGTKSATINVTPSSGSYAIGEQFSVDLVIDGGGQAFNAARARVAVSPNLTVSNLSITASPEGCGFTFIDKKNPTALNPSFAGGILKGFSSGCKLYTLTLMANASGVGTVTIDNESVKDYLNHSEIFLSSTSGSYNVSTAATPTPTTAATPTPTVIPIPTDTPTPTPTVAPPETPTFDNIPTKTYSTSVTLSGAKSANTVSILLNGSTANVVYPTSITWQSLVSLALGPNLFTINGQDSNGNISPTNSITIERHKVADISGDGIIDLTDLSLFGVDYESTQVLNNPLSDMDGDGLVDLTDFSILAKLYEG